MVDQFKIYSDESTSLSANGSDSLVFDIPQDVEFEVFKILFTSTGTFKITELYDAKGQHYLSGSLYSGQLSETTLLKLQETMPPLIFQSKLYFKITDTSGDTNNIYISIVGISKG